MEDYLEFGKKETIIVIFPVIFLQTKILLTILDGNKYNIYENEKINIYFVPLLDAL